MEWELAIFLRNKSVHVHLNFVLEILVVRIQFPYVTLSCSVFLEAQSFEAVRRLNKEP